MKPSVRANSGEILRLYVEGQKCAFVSADLYYGKDSIPSMDFVVPATDEILKLPPKTKVNLIFGDTNYDTMRFCSLYEGLLERRSFSSSAMGERYYTFTTTHITSVLNELKLQILSAPDYIMEVLSGNIESKISQGNVTGTIWETLQPKKLIELSNKYKHKYNYLSSAKDNKNFDIFDYVRGAFLVLYDISQGSFIKESHHVKTFKEFKLMERLYDPPNGSKLNWEMLFTEIMQLFFLGTIPNMGNGDMPFLPMIKNILQLFLYEFNINPNPRNYKYTMQVKPDNIFAPIPTCNVIYPIYSLNYNYSELWDQKPTRLIQTVNPPNGIEIPPELKRYFRIYSPPELDKKMEDYRKAKASGKSDSTLKNETLNSNKNGELGVLDLITEEERERGIYESRNELPSYLANAFEIVLFDKGTLLGANVKNVGGIQVSTENIDNLNSVSINTDIEQGTSEDLVKADKIRFYHKKLLKLENRTQDMNSYNDKCFVPLRITIIKPHLIQGKGLSNYVIQNGEIKLNKNRDRYYHLFTEPTGCLPLALKFSDLKESEINKMDLNLSKFILIGSDIKVDSKPVLISYNEKVDTKTLAESSTGGVHFNLIIELDEDESGVNDVGISFNSLNIARCSKLIGNIANLCSIDINSAVQSVNYYYADKLSDLNISDETLTQIKAEALIYSQELKVEYEKNKSTAISSISKNYVSKAFLPIDAGKYVITSNFGPRNISKGSKNHRGMDLAGAIGTPLKAVLPGVVSFAQWTQGYGKYIKISHGKQYDNIETAYGHCNEIYVKPGQKVAPGQIIGTLGNTGVSTGPHLHFELFKNGVQVDPESFLDLIKTGKLKLTKTRPELINMPTVQAPLPEKEDIKNLPPPPKDIQGPPLPNEFLPEETINTFSEFLKGNDKDYGKSLLNAQNEIIKNFNDKDITLLVKEVPNISKLSGLSGEESLTLLTSLAGQGSKDNLLGLGGAFLEENSVTLDKVNDLNNQLHLLKTKLPEMKKFATDDFKKLLETSGQAALLDNPEYQKASQIYSMLSQLKLGSVETTNLISEQLKNIQQKAVDKQEEMVKNASVLFQANASVESIVKLYSQAYKGIVKESEEKAKLFEQMKNNESDSRVKNDGQRVEEMSSGQKTKLEATYFKYMRPITDYMYYRNRYAASAQNIQLAFNPYCVPGFGSVIIDNSNIKNKIHLLGQINSINHNFSASSISTSAQVGFIRRADEDVFNPINVNNQPKDVFERLAKKDLLKQSFYDYIQKILFFGGEYATDIIDNGTVTTIDKTYNNLFGNEVISARRESVTGYTNFYDINDAYQKNKREIQTCKITAPTIPSTQLINEYNSIKQLYDSWYSSAPSRISFEFAGKNVFPDKIKYIDDIVFNQDIQVLVRLHNNHSNNFEGLIGSREEF